MGAAAKKARVAAQPGSVKPVITIHDSGDEANPIVIGDTPTADKRQRKTSTSKNKNPKGAADVGKASFKTGGVKPGRSSGGQQREVECNLEESESDGVKMKENGVTLAQNHRAVLS